MSYGSLKEKLEREGVDTGSVQKKLKRKKGLQGAHGDAARASSHEEEEVATENAACPAERSALTAAAEHKSAKDRWGASDSRYFRFHAACICGDV